MSLLCNKIMNYMNFMMFNTYFLACKKYCNFLGKECFNNFVTLAPVILHK
jgi:hypothetical protein